MACRRRDVTDETNWEEAVASTGDVVIDPTDDNTVWVATGEGNPRNDVIPGAGV